MLALVVVGSTRVIVSPARASNDANSRGVRSAPPVNAIITMSELPKPGALPSRSTSSMMSNRLVGVIAARQLRRMVRHLSSFQSWMTCERRYASAPGGTDSKALPPLNRYAVRDAEGL